MEERRTRHVPQRRCLGCGASAPKRELARFVALPEGEGAHLVRDTAGRLGGRGLYVCPRGECFERAVTRRSFARGARLAANVLHIDPSLGTEFTGSG